MAELYATSSIDWKPSPVVALATSADESQVAAAREDGSVEIWLVSPGSVGWHCQLTIHGSPNSRVSSLVWCRSGPRDAPSGRLFSSSIDGSVSEWDLFHLRQKIVLDSTGVSIWQMAVEPRKDPGVDAKHDSHSNGNGIVIDSYSDDDSGSSESDDDDDSVEVHEQSLAENPCIAVACDDGCVRLYTISDADKFAYHKSFPRVSGRVLSVAWSPDGNMIYSGSSDGLIRCWDAKRAHNLYRITVGLGGLGNGQEICVWSLLALRYGTLVSADSTGSVQFWDSQHGTLLQAHTFHRGDAYALATVPSHTRVFSAGADGKIILYKLSSSATGSNDVNNLPSEAIRKWIYVDYKEVHSHDVRALTLAVPISHEDVLPSEKVKRVRRKEKPADCSYNKWAHLGVPMLLSAGDDTKIFAYSAREFTKYQPYDICHAPNRVPMQLVLNSVFNQMPLLLVQASNEIDILSLSLENGVVSNKVPGHLVRVASTKLLARVDTHGSEKIVCSTISPSGSLFSYSTHVKLSLFELKKSKQAWTLSKRQLPRKLPFAHSMTFTSDSSRLIIAGHDRKIYIVDAGSLELLHVFTPGRKAHDEDLPPSEPPITKLYTSCDGQWLAAINCFGDIYIFNLEIERQHWFISRLDGASVTAGGFPPHNSNVLVVTTSSNQVYAFDVEAKQLGEWSRRNSFSLPPDFLEFPGEVIGLSFPPSTGSSSVVIYSSRAMCLIDFGMPVHPDGGSNLINGLDSIAKKLIPVNGRLKRKLQEHDLDINPFGRKNFGFIRFQHPVLFIGHLSKKALIFVDKPWEKVLKTLDTNPVHRHIFGT